MHPRPLPIFAALGLLALAGCDDWSEGGRLMNLRAATNYSGPCHPSYTGACVPIVRSDVDCAGDGDADSDGPRYVYGPVTVVGRDVYRLDPDKDGVACD
jgi:hypothetical protein